MRVDVSPKIGLMFIALLLVLFTVKPHILLAAAGSFPDYYGVYAREGGRFVRMEQHQGEVTKFAFRPDVTFVIYDRWLSQGFGIPLTEAIVVKRQFYIRNHVLTGPRFGSPHRVSPFDGWVAPDFEAPLPILVKPVKGQTEAVEVVPKEPFPPGVYLLRILDTPITFSVRFADIEIDNFCFDLYTERIGSILGETTYRRCASFPAEPKR